MSTKAIQPGREMLGIFVLGIASVLLSARSDAGLGPQKVYIDVEGGKLRFAIVGSGTAVPPLLLHGDPGGPSHYLEPLRRVAVDRPVIFYD